MKFFLSWSENDKSRRERCSSLLAMCVWYSGRAGFPTCVFNVVGPGVAHRPAPLTVSSLGAQFCLFRISRRWRSYWWPWRRWSKSWSPWRRSCPPLSSRWLRRKRIWPTSGLREGSTWRKFWRWSKYFYHVLYSLAVLVLITFIFWLLATLTPLRLTCSLDLGQILVK